MGMYCGVSAASREDVDSGKSFGRGTSVSLEKAWHGLHYLLTGEPWGGDGPAAFLLAGGEQIGGDDESPRWFKPDETVRINQALAAISDSELWSRFDAEEMEQKEIYPGIWDEDEEELKEEYLTYFNEMKKVIAAAVQSGKGLLVNIG